MLRLLLEKERKLIKSEYAFRFSSILLLSLSAVVIFWIISMTPTFVTVFFEQKLLKEQVQDVESVELLNEKNSLTEGFSDFRDKLNILDVSEYNPTDLIREVTKYQIRSISLSNITFDTKNGKKVIGLQGVANNRESLSEFASELEKSDLFVKVDLPFSNFTKDIDIPFVLTIDLKSLENNE